MSLSIPDLTSFDPESLKKYAEGLKAALSASEKRKKILDLESQIAAENYKIARARTAAAFENLEKLEAELEDRKREDYKIFQRLCHLVARIRRCDPHELENRIARTAEKEALLATQEENEKYLLFEQSLDDLKRVSQSGNYSSEEYKLLSQRHADIRSSLVDDHIQALESCLKNSSQEARVESLIKSVRQEIQRRGLLSRLKLLIIKIFQGMKAPFNLNLRLYKIDELKEDKRKKVDTFKVIKELEKETQGLSIVSLAPLVGCTTLLVSVLASIYRKRFIKTLNLSSLNFFIFKILIK